jgi:SAM-dependent methyltransferase
MQPNDRLSYTEETADVYDAWFGDYLDAAPAVDRLASLATLNGPGPVLELGIGTGRVALPLVARGLDVHGVDASEAMVAQLRAKPGGMDIPVTIGDFSEMPTAGAFALIFVVAGSFFELPSQEAQVRCFENVARRLRPGGLFAIHGLVPDASRSAGDQDIRLIPTGDDRLMVRFRKFDLVEQRYTSNYLVAEGGAARHLKVQFRYAWPSELDLMARLAGLRLQERSASWSGEPFTSSSPSHISIYERPASAPGP